MRHKWKNYYALNVDYPGAYDAFECTVCGCIRYHLFTGGCFSKKYLKDGTYFDRLPGCK